MLEEEKTQMSWIDWLVILWHVTWKVAKHWFKNTVCSVFNLHPPASWPISMVHYDFSWAGHWGADIIRYFGQISPAPPWALRFLRLRGFSPTFINNSRLFPINCQSSRQSRNLPVSLKGYPKTYPTSPCWLGLLSIVNCFKNVNLNVPIVLRIDYLSRN